MDTAVQQLDHVGALLAKTATTPQLTKAPQRLPPSRFAQ
ncbi:Unannotated, partial [Lentimonas sp. CC10]